MLLFITLTSLLAWATPEVKTVDKVDLNQYLGLWNELYRIPNRFQDNSSESKSVCYDTTAEYTELPGGGIRVRNTCKRKIDGVEKSEVAEARGGVIENSANAKLTVNFTGMAILRWVGIGNGNYWILGLGAVNKQNQYSWALVGDPDRKYGWILAREKTLPAAELAKIFAIAEANGYEKARFSLIQPPTH